MHRALKPERETVLSTTIKESRLHPILSGPPVIAPYNHSDTLPSPQSLYGTAPPSCPKARLGRNAAAVTATRKARYQGVRHHWRHAKRLSASVTAIDMAAWLRFNSIIPLPIIDTHTAADYKGEAEYFWAWLLSNKLRIKQSIQILVKIRRALNLSKNTCGALKINAAIWKIIAGRRRHK